MTWKSEIGLGELLNLVALIGAIVGLYFTYRQIKQSTLTARAEFIKTLVTDFYGNAAIFEVFYLIDCDELPINEIISWNSGKGYDHLKSIEKSLDSLLGYLDTVARLCKMKVVTENDLKVLEYEITICYKSSAVQAYLSYLDELYIRKNLTIKPHWYFRELASRFVLYKSPTL